MGGRIPVPRCEMCGSRIVTARWRTRRFCDDCREIRHLADMARRSRQRRLEALYRPLEEVSSLTIENEN